MSVPPPPHFFKVVPTPDLESIFDAPAFDDSNSVDGSFFFDQLFADDSDETSETITPRVLKNRAKRSVLRVRQKEFLRDLVKSTPQPGEALHVVSANRFNFWTWVPVLIDWLGAADEFYCATWTANFQSVKEFFELWDAGKICKTAGFLLGTYFKRREPVVYTKLAEGLAKRGGWIKAFETHCKILLLNVPEQNAYLTVEGSANLTANPRLEQYVISNDRALWEFHRQWFLEMKSLKGKLPWA